MGGEDDRPARARRTAARAGYIAADAAGATARVRTARVRTVRVSPSPTHASTGFPVWAIVLIVVAILAIPAGIVAAVAIPMFLSQHDKANDSSVKEGIHRLQVGIQSYAVDNGDIYPQPEDVTPEGAVGRYVDRWPTNPWSGEPMRPGAEPGDYRYTVIDEGFGATGFSLEGYLHDGEPFVVP